MTSESHSLDQLLANHATPRLFDGGFGLEKENLRVDSDGKLTRSPHPASLGDKLKHPYITTDFSESQIEMITPVLSSPREALGFLETIHDEVSLNLEHEYLWPQSSPPHLPENDSDIPIAQFNPESNDGQEKENYREKLAEKYGRKKQMFCGVHFNISFDEQVLNHLFQQKKTGKSKDLPHYDRFREQLYLRALRNFKRYRWFLIALLGNSPAVHRSYIQCCVEKLPRLSEEAVHHTFATSMRNGICGYRNHQFLGLNYDSLELYHQSLQQLIDDQVVDSARENYASIRLKFSPSDNKHISHLELRLLDLNPMLKAGIDLHHLEICHLFLVYCLLKHEASCCNHDCLARAFENHERAATVGLNPETTILCDDNTESPLQTELINIYTDIEDHLSNILPPHYRQGLEQLQSLVESPHLRPAAILKQILQQNSYIGWTMNQTLSHLTQSQSATFTFHGHQDMELSTQLVMRNALLRGLDLEVMDRAANFIRLSDENREQYVMQATRTSLDNYASVLLMENKVMTKKIIDRAGIRVPRGTEYNSETSAKEDFNFFKGQAIVIKPKSTNFGLGITILKQNITRQHFQQAVDIAFKHDRSILIETFIPGNEYRFFIIQNKVVAILQRVPANVTGDGSSSIRELIALKNKDPLRGKGYRTPLEKLATGEEEALFLSTQGLDFDAVPADKQSVYLRENSNISTGGDSIDVTDLIPKSYQIIAAAAAQAMNVEITGLDMMISDPQQEASDSNYAIIEMNFNPAIHIHCFPYRGKNRHLDAKILDALFPPTT